MNIDFGNANYLMVELTQDPGRVRISGSGCDEITGKTEVGFNFMVSLERAESFMDEMRDLITELKRVTGKSQNKGSMK